MNSINLQIILFSMAGGLALFLYGMDVLSHGLQMAAGNKLKKLLEKLTDNKLSGVGIGAVVTAIIQSSSITTVTLVGLINAGIITFSQSIPVIMGSNIGTTITAQLIAFKIGKLSLPIIAVGFIIYSVYKKNMYKYLGQIILGFGILFLGMNLMSGEAKQLIHSKEIVEMLAEMGKVPVLGILAGMLFTGIIQSSSATSGLVISMGMGSKSLLDLKAAVAIMLGANIGTCITVVLASIGSTLSSKRAALAHVLIKTVGVLMILVVLNPFLGMVKLTSSDLGRQIANAHLLFNVISTIILLPFTGLIEKIVIKLKPGDEIKLEDGARYLDENTLQTPVIALDMAEKEILRMAKITLSMIESSRIAFFELNKREIQVVQQKEKIVDMLDVSIGEFLSKINHDGLSARQIRNLLVLDHVITDLERIGDHANNICELAKQRIDGKFRFTGEALDELKDVFDKTDRAVTLSPEVIRHASVPAINEVKQIECEVDEMTIQMEQDHLERLDEGYCHPKAGPVYLDVLRNLERITDHMNNIASSKSIGI